MKQRRTELLQVRLTPDELDRIRLAARVMGVTVSEFMRQSVFFDPDEPPVNLPTGTTRINVSDYIAEEAALAVKEIGLRVVKGDPDAIRYLIERLGH